MVTRRNRGGLINGGGGRAGPGAVDGWGSWPAAARALLSAALVLGLALASCGRDDGESGGVDVDAGVGIEVFTASQSWGDAPLSTTLSWVLDEGEPAVCHLSIGSDGAMGQTFDPCPVEGEHSVVLTEPGRHTARLVVEGTRDASTEASLDLFANRLVFRDNVVFPEEHPAFIGVQLEESSVVLEYESAAVVPSFEQGQILWGVSAGGYLRWVLSVSVDGATVVIGTEPAVIEDAVSEGFFGIKDHEVVLDHVGCVEDCLDAEIIRKNRGMEKDGSRFHALELTFPDIDVTDGVTLEDPAVEVGFTIDEMVLDVWWTGVREFKMKITPKVRSSTELRIEDDDEEDGLGVSFEETYPLGNWVLGVAPIGPIPVTFNFSPEIKLSASASLGLFLPLEIHGSISGWVHYVDGGIDSGVGANFGAGFSDEPVAGGEAEARVTLRPKVATRLLGVAGPFISPDAYVRALASANILTAEVCLEAGCGADIALGASIELFRQKLEISTSYNVIEFMFFEQCWGGCQQDCDGRECGPDPVCGEDCAPGCDEGLECNEHGRCMDPEAVCPDEVDCSGQECGFDPVCGEPCPPGCGEGEHCNVYGQCIDAEAVCPDEMDCSGRECGFDPVCGEPCTPGCDLGETCDSSGQCVSSGCGDECGEMVAVPSGTFMMGCNEDVDDYCHDSEFPYHAVDVPEFEIDEYPVTVAEYGACVDAGACTEPGPGSRCNTNFDDRDDHPMNCINWYQAREYCDWAGKRLCTEAEWEMAARGTDERLYPWGNESATCEHAVFNQEGGTSGSGCGEDRTWPVGSKPPGVSPAGAFDMSGNVWEWVEDNYHANYIGAPTDGSAWVTDGSLRVRRGGAFDNPAGRLRASSRSGVGPRNFSEHYGARCCR